MFLQDPLKCSPIYELQKVESKWIIISLSYFSAILFLVVFFKNTHEKKMEKLFMMGNEIQKKINSEKHVWLC